MIINDIRRLGSGRYIPSQASKGVWEYFPKATLDLNVTWVD